MKEKLQNVLTFIIGLVIVVVISMPFLALSLGVAVKLFEWAK